jgi:sulfane dehydrogenase subunit SoxC
MRTCDQAEAAADGLHNGGGGAHHAPGAAYMHTQDPSPETAPLRTSGRRQFLGSAAVAMAAALPARAAEPSPPAAPPGMRSPGLSFLNPPYGLPSPFEKKVVRKLPDSPAAFPTATRTPLQDLLGTITPNGLFFERHHAGVPTIDPDAHRLMLHGLVDRPLVFTMSELMRFPSVTRVHFLECSGNSAAEWARPSGKTAQDVHGLLSCAEWTGVPLAVLLQEAGVQPEGRWILAEGADAAAMTRSVPIEKALKDALVVYGQNGERLRPEQGYPLRLLLPGFEGNMNIKWLRRLKVGRTPFQTREETSKYTDLMPDGSARQFTFGMDAKSVITSPSGMQQLGPHGFHEISGLAWTGNGRIRTVDVSVDGGRSWREAVLQEPVQSMALTRFRLPWSWSGEPAVLQSRAVDEAGYVQPTRDALIAKRGLNSTYHYNGIQSWAVAANGEVRNVHA